MAAVFYHTCDRGWHFDWAVVHFPFAHSRQGCVKSGGVSAGAAEFSDFLHVVLVSLFFLIPAEGDKALGMELLLVGILRIKLLFKQAKFRAGSGQKSTVLKMVSEYVMPVISTAGLLIAGVEIYLGDNAIASIYYVVVPVIAALLFSACSNAWLLLMEEKSA